MARRKKAVTRKAAATKAKTKVAAKKSAKKVVALKAKEAGAESGYRQRPAAAIIKAVGPGRQGARRRQDPRLHPCAVGADLHAASRLSWAPT